MNSTLFDEEKGLERDTINKSVKGMRRCNCINEEESFMMIKMKGIRNDNVRSRTGVFQGREKGQKHVTSFFFSVFYYPSTAV